MLGFILWREFKLSIAEITSVLPECNIEFCSNSVMLISGVTKEEVLAVAKKMWGSMKIIEVLDSIKPTYESITSCVLKYQTEGKFSYAVNTYNVKIDLKKILMSVKRGLKEIWKSSRFINKDFKNANSAQIIWEKLVNKWSDFNVIMAWDRGYFTKTIHIQNIYEYSKRDIWKTRDMQIWMLPPKLAQMMINLSLWKVIYDPFVGLGTVLIESLHMWNKKVFGSDINPRMVETATENVLELKERKFEFESSIFALNAKFISERTSELSQADAIVTEWYLWEVMTQNNITMERIEKQKESLESIYSKFFVWLSESKFKGRVVISLPFWEMKWKYYYCENIYPIIEENMDIISPRIWSFSPTKMGSLLYKRDAQLVGREVFVLEVKN